MSKTKDKAAAGMLAGMTAGHAQHAIDHKLAGDAARARSVALLDVDAIEPRADDTREARADHVLALAESIAAVGLLQPPAVDRNRRLVAGLHRWTACRLLLAEPKDRPLLLAHLEGAAKVEDVAARLAALPAPADLPEPLKGRMLPCRVLEELDATKDTDAALAAEAAENTARKQYTPGEVAALVERLKAAGYREKGGRPRRGERALRPAIELVLGVSSSTARRMLGTKDQKAKHGHVATFCATLPKVGRAVEALAAAELPTGTKAPALRQFLKAAHELDKLLPAALAEAKALEADQ